MENQKRTEERPWGKFTIIDEGPNYRVKRIFVRKGRRLSLQRHEHRDEHWSFVSGIGTLTLELPGNLLAVLKNSGEPLLKTTMVGPNFQAKIPKGLLHRVEAITDLVFFEVAIGDVDENDIERVEDDYGRLDKVRDKAKWTSENE